MVQQLRAVVGAATGITLVSRFASPPNVSRFASSNVVSFCVSSVHVPGGCEGSHIATCLSRMSFLFSRGQVSAGYPTHPQVFYDDFGFVHSCNSFDRPYELLVFL